MTLQNREGMRDVDIRRVLHAQLEVMHGDDPDTVVRHEMGLCAGERRIDIAVLNGSIEGYEIKSDVDTLARLSGQAEVYGQILDRAYVVTTDRYIEKAIDLLPDWWGVMRAFEVNGVVRLAKERRGKKNRRFSSMALAQLLWREEALAELQLRGLHRGLSQKARWYVWERLAAEVPQRELKDVVRTRLKARTDWKGGQVPWQCADVTGLRWNS